jgi:coenzyme F420 biosynthesis associated uncharacterized protein
MPSLVDWDLAAATASRLVPPGPSIGYEDAASVVAELREAAGGAREHVRALTGMDGGDGDQRPAGEQGTRESSPVAVLDRPGWVRANVDGFRSVIDPLADELLARRDGPGKAPSPIVTAVGSRLTGVQVGAILAYLATRVLGQYELFAPAGAEAGRLSLVAPNVVETERRLGVDPTDFRLWVCLHEATHQLQFTEVPWLREHVQAEMAAYLRASDLDASALLSRVRQALGIVVDTVRGQGEASLLEALQTPEQQRILDRITGLMSLLEGHGEYVMDAIGPDVVPSVATIRQRFDARRREGNRVEKAVRRLLGIEMKIKQYAEGAAFVRAVIRRIGMDGFNRVWTSPNTLPTHAEIRDPDAWVARVTGLPPAASA